MNKHQRKLKSVPVGVYDVLKKFDVICPAMQQEVEDMQSRIAELEDLAYMVDQRNDQGAGNLMTYKDAFETASKTITNQTALIKELNGLEGKYKKLKYRSLKDIDRIVELEKWIAAIADRHEQIPGWIQQSARSLLAVGAECGAEYVFATTTEV